MRIGEKITNPGDLRTRIVLEERISQNDSGGFPQTTVGEKKTVWCRWINLHGSEVWQADAAGAAKAATVLLRYLPDLDETWHVHYRGETWEIRSIDNIQERDEYMELKVSRIGAG